MTEKQRFKVIETITHDDKKIYELTKNDIGYYNFKSEKLLAHMICNELNILLEENKRLKFESETLKSNYQREIQSSIDFCNTYSKTNGELLEEIEQLKQSNKDAWNLIRFIYNEIKEDGYMDWGRIQDLVEF